MMTIHPNEEKICLAYHHTDVIEIYSFNGEQIFSGQGPNSFHAKPSPKEADLKSHFKLTKETKQAFVGLKSDRKYIYLLYNGIMDAKSLPQANKLFVFDWNGKPIKLFEFNEDLYSFDINLKNKVMYSYSVSKGQLVYAKFEI